MLIAHIRESDFKRQSVLEHLEAVSYLCGIYGSEFGFRAIAELSGLLHDMGKLTRRFTEYLEQVVIEKKKINEKINHSSAGARYLFQKYYIKNPVEESDFYRNLVIEVISMNILAHHAGLYDFITSDRSVSDFHRRISQEDLPNYDEVLTEWKKLKLDRRVEELLNRGEMEIKTFIKNLSSDENHSQNIFLYLSYIQRITFSCLIDADRTDTRRFEEKDSSPLFYNIKKIFLDAYHALMNQMEEWNKDKKKTTKLNRLRTEMSDQCEAAANEPSGVYKMEVPTGGGKTLASLRYALKHAIKYNKKRIIYIVPYTTILEQNADAVRQFFSDDSHVLEHHSNIIQDDSMDQYNDYYQMSTLKKMQLGRDNFDHPVIFTTMVQYLDTFFAKGTRKSRRLHNFADAVIVIDEAQTVPSNHLDLFNSTVNFLTKVAKSSVVMCTATQPAFQYLKYPIYIDSSAEMIADLATISKEFERVKFHNHVADLGWSTEELSGFVKERAKDHKSILVILNTKKAVLQLYQALQDIETHKVYHLSTSMCPAHRKDQLADIKMKLKKEPIICISTQLIEAGVDISFQAVIRSLAGLDSIAQAAGRCNREGEAAYGDVYLVNSAVENLSKLKEIKIGSKITLDYIINQENAMEELLSPAMIERYFAFYYNELKANQTPPKNLNYPLIDYLDEPDQYFNSGKTEMQTMYRTVERNFQAIEQETRAVIVPYTSEGKALIAALNEEQPLEELNKLLRQAQQYVVNMYDYEFRSLANEDYIKNLFNDTLYVLKEAAYNDEYGVSAKGEGRKSELIF